MQPARFLNGYRMMWMMVMFDLPVLTKHDRKEYSRFRNHLLDSGFEMTQFSIYMRLLSSKERVIRFEKRIAKHLPKQGKVQIVTITDKQYENIKAFYGAEKQDAKKQTSYSFSRRVRPEFISRNSRFFLSILILPRTRV